MKKLVLPLVMLFGVTGTAYAFDGDAEAGKAKSATCAACHNADGNSSIEMYPKIAGQHATYIYKQLKDFKLHLESGGSSGRAGTVMAGMVAPLSDQDMKDLSAYFASQKMSAGSTPEDVIEHGGKLYRGGDTERGIAACIACHGPRGNGTSLSVFPKISYQNATYLKTALEEFRNGTRQNDPSGMMQDIARKLTDEDIDVLSKYLGGLH